MDKQIPSACMRWEKRDRDLHARRIEIRRGSVYTFAEYTIRDHDAEIRRTAKPEKMIEVSSFLSFNRMW